MSLLPGADFSEWDGGALHTRPLNWQAYTWPFAFVKVSQGLHADPLFEIQWAAARGHVLRSAYHFFEPSKDPRESALKTIEYLKGDLGELPLALDLEITEGMSNVLDRAKSWLSWYEARTGVRPIIYSSPNFLNNVVHAASYPFLANYKLWLSQWPFDKIEPDDHREEIIAGILSGAYTLNWPSPPPPFKKVSFYQWTAQGKPGQVPGYTGGDAKKEVDLNFYQGSAEELREEFGVTTETPAEPPTGEPMPDYAYEITPAFSDGSKIRPEHNVNNTATSKLAFTQIARGNEDWVAPADGLNVKKGDRWLHVLVVDPAGNVDGWIAEIHLGVRYATIKQISTPPAPSEDRPKRVTLEMESGKVFIADQFTQQ